LTVTADKKTSIITIKTEMPDPFAAADLVRVVRGQLMERIINYESKKAEEQYQFVKEQYDRARNRYNKAQRELAIYSDRNRMLASATAQLDRETLQRESDLSFEVYGQLSRELEQAKIKMNQDTPVFTILEDVTVPVTYSTPRRAQTIVLSLLIGAVLGIGRIAMQNVLGKTMLDVQKTASGQ
jgi:uncharacterized protein involved in exopolysaccharide biosynthesis